MSIEYRVSIEYTASTQYRLFQLEGYERTEGEGVRVRVRARVRVKRPSERLEGDRTDASRGRQTDADGRDEMNWAEAVY